MTQGINHCWQRRSEKDTGACHVGTQTVGNVVFENSLYTLDYTMPVDLGTWGQRRRTMFAIYPASIYAAYPVPDTWIFVPTSLSPLSGGQLSPPTARVAAEVVLAR